jgi:hypothetical protein
MCRDALILAGEPDKSVSREIQNEKNAENLKTSFKQPLWKLRIGCPVFRKIDIRNDESGDEYEGRSQKPKIPVVVRAKKVIVPVVQHHEKYKRALCEIEG